MSLLCVKECVVGHGNLLLNARGEIGYVGNLIWNTVFSMNKVWIKSFFMYKREENLIIIEYSIDLFRKI